VSIQIKVKATSETVVDDAEIQHQRHRARRVGKVGRQLNIPTMSTPAFSNVLRLGFMCGTEKVSQLLNRPVMSLFGTRMSGTSTEMVSHRIQLKLPATQAASGFSAMTGIWAPMVMAKKVCQRLADQASSLR
jgi:hypothetical protein